MPERCAVSHEVGENIAAGQRRVREGEPNAEKLHRVQKERHEFCVQSCQARGNTRKGDAHSGRMPCWESIKQTYVRPYVRACMRQTRCINLLQAVIAACTVHQHTQWYKGTWTTQGLHTPVFKCVTLVRKDSCAPSEQFVNDNVI